MPPPAPTPSPTPAPKSKLYRALTPIEHDQEPTAEGKTLRLDDKAAAPLLAVKAIELAGKSGDKEEAAE